MNFVLFFRVLQEFVQMTYLDHISASVVTEKEAPSCHIFSECLHLFDWFFFAKTIKELHKYVYAHIYT